MSARAPINYADASPQVRAVYDDIKASRKVEDHEVGFCPCGGDNAAHGALGQRGGVGAVPGDYGDSGAGGEFVDPAAGWLECP